MSDLIENIINIFKFDHFYDFMIQNGIVSTTAAVVIAYSAWDFIKSFVGDLFLPAFYFTFIFPFLGEKSAFHSIYFAPIEKLDIPNFLKNTISFFIVVMITYFLIQNIVLNFIPNKIANLPVTASQPPVSVSQPLVAASVTTSQPPVTVPVTVSQPTMKPTSPYFLANPQLGNLQDMNRPQDLNLPMARAHEIPRIGR